MADDAQRIVKSNWERLLFQRPRSDTSDEMSAWLMTVLGVSSKFKCLGGGSSDDHHQHESSSSDMSISSSNHDSSSRSSSNNSETRK
jgi:hypothetical protein